MYIFRRAAARAVSAPRQIRASPRVNSFQSSIPSLTRSLHQSRIWRVEEQKKESHDQDALSESSGSTSAPLGQSEHSSESASQPTQTRPSSTSSGADALSESSGTTSEPIGQSEQSKPVTEQASEFAEKAKETASDVAAKAAQAVGEITQQPQQKAHEAAVNATEKAQEIGSKVSEQAQSAAGYASEQAQQVSEQAKSATANATEQAKETASQVSEQAQPTIEQAKGQAQQVSEQAQSATANATEQAQQTASQVSEQAQSAASEASRATRDTAGSIRDQVKERKPFTRDNNASSRILYVGNLFFEVTAPQLETEFAKYGEASNSRVVTDNRGLSKGFAYIEFATQPEADAALEALNQKSFQGRRLSVQYHRRRDAGARDATNSVRGPAKPSKTLFIGNMSYQMSDRDLNDLFRQIKNVLDVRVAIDRRSGQPRGFAHADFIDVESATRAKEILEQKSVYGRQLKVDYSGQASTSHRGDRNENRGEGSGRYERSERPERRRDDRDSY